ncbi:MAG TPA: FAD-binding and (Fe-S)-binding domain-containing protein [Thermoanaerobaculia bacterium]|jgi:FAD/FMN-containing dehydrogenase/Fe-S oxidoreductase|nr:FAD-binding and (Fe-S)-binding domain-containing protein [Thermoanaerobaculia bacterium]
MSDTRAENFAARFDPVAFEHDRSVRTRIEHSDRIQTLNVDAEILASELREAVRGEVRFDDGSRALYATDASNYRQVPIGVVIPRDADDVVATVALACKHGAPILARGGGTSLAGQCCNVAVVLDFSKYMHHIRELNAEGRYARIEPGIILDDLRNAAEKQTLTFGPDPATHSHCTLGGMIGNNSCGVHGLMAGKTVDNIEELEILTYDGVRMRVGATSDAELEGIIAEGGRRGEIYAGMKRIRDTYGDLIRAKYPKIPRRVSGYNLDSLLPENGFNVAQALVGSECTCVVVLEAKCRLVYSPPSRTLVVLGYDDIYLAADDVPRLLEFNPIGLEGIDDRLIADMKAKGMNIGNIALLPEGKGWLLVEFGGETKEASDGYARTMIASLAASPFRPSYRLFDDKKEAKMIWAIRESGLGATAFVPGKGHSWEGWEDSAVDPNHLGEYLRELRTLLDRYGYIGALYGHFGQACVHTRNDFDLESAAGIARFGSYINAAADLCVKYGGSLSGEHGDGQARAALLPKMFGPELVQAFNEFKSLWDPEWKMNPGKVVMPYHPTENLRLGADFHQWSPKTHFQFPEDEGRIDRALTRCVGVGKCRRIDGGTMCPSFMVTREEEHSTRGRARLLFEMFEGQVIPADWNNEAVKDSLDLCLACKGCKGDCPVNVDMATYKAEFLSHYYEGKLRPPAAYSMGWIYWWARAAEIAPEVANAVMSLPITRALAGVAPERRMPRFAKRTFVKQFSSSVRRPRGAARKKVLLWPDTFNNHFRPNTANAAAEVLEAAGYEVIIPRKRLCCGRPLYDWGFLGMAKGLLQETMEALRPELEEGIPIVGLEPSCISVFRDELPNLFPDDDEAIRLSKAVKTLPEFLLHEHVELPKLHGKALVQGHCHHKAVLHFSDEEQVLKKLGLDVDSPDSGCCGMAGAFGFEHDKYELSMRIGERVLLPAVREAARGTIIVADGFSCREQIAQGTGREALHLAQVLHMAMQEEPAGELPERRYAEKPATMDVRKVAWKVAGIAGGIALIAGGIALLRKRRRRRNRDRFQ